MKPEDKKRLEEIRERVKDVQSRKERMGVGNLTLGYTQDFAFLLRLLDEERERVKFILASEYDAPAITDQRRFARNILIEKIAASLNIPKEDLQ